MFLSLFTPNIHITDEVRPPLTFTPIPFHLAKNPKNKSKNKMKQKKETKITPTIIWLWYILFNNTFYSYVIKTYYFDIQIYCSKYIFLKNYT